MVEALEQTLLKLLQPDSNIIQQATDDLRQLVKHPDIVPLFCQILVSSTRVEVRQYAAVLLRRKLLKKKVWSSLLPEISQEIKKNLISIFLNEQDKATKKSLSQLIATIAKHDISSNKWPELFEFFDLSLKDPLNEEIGMNLLMAVSSIASKELKPHLNALLKICAANIKKTSNYMIPFYTVKTLLNLISSVGTENQKQFQAIIPDIIIFIKQLIVTNQELSIECLEVFEELINCEVPLLSPHVKPSFQLFLEISKEQNLGAPLRVRGLTLISELIGKKKKLISKLNAIPILVTELFSILCENDNKTDDDDDDDDELEAEKSSPSSTAGQVLDMMALHLPPEKLIPPLMKQIEPAFENPNPNFQRAAFLALAVVTEGCTENIRNKHLKKLMKIIFKGMTSEYAEVRNAAMYAMGEFCDYLQPDVGKYSQELLPLLFECLARSSDPAATKEKDVIKTYYAVEKFCENLGKDILPYLPQLIKFLMNAIQNAASFNVKELAISTLSAISVSASEDMVPYVPDVINTLKVYLTPTDEEGPLKVQTQTLDTLGQFARNIGVSFKGYAAELVLLGLQLINDSTDPDLRRACYSLFGSCATLLKDDMQGHLPTIIPMLIGCMRSTEGITAHFDDEETAHVTGIFDGGEEGDDDESFELLSSDKDDHEDESHANNIESIELQNSYMDEKSEAISALGDIAINTGHHFLPYIEQSYKETKDLLIYMDSDIRNCAATTSSQLCCAMATLIKTLPELESSVGPGFLIVLKETLANLISMCREDEDREVVISVLRSIIDIVSGVGLPAISALDSIHSLLNLVKDVIQRKVKCQENATFDQYDDDEDDDDDAEYDSVMIELAGELLPTISKVIGGEKFAPYFGAILPEFMKKMKKNSPVNDKSFAVGTCAEVLHEMGDFAAQFCPKLLPTFTAMARDEDEEVRNNAIYGLGICAANGGQPIRSHFMDILKLLSETLLKETNERCRNNICAAVCRMILTDQASIPISQVLPTIVNNLPFKEDLEEHKTVFKCFSLLYGQRNPDLITLLPNILNAIGQILVGKVDPELLVIMKPMLLDISINFQQPLSNMAATLPSHAVETLKQLLQQ